MAATENGASMKIKFDYDAHGCALCPLCDDVPPYKSECHATWRGVHTIWMFGVPHEATPTVIEAPEVPDYATTSYWRVECVNGHVLALSEGEETAEPFDPAALFAAPERV